jgi:putative SOS response-associated peptidase YedK
MCGRIKLTKQQALIVDGIEEIRDVRLTPRFNITPNQRTRVAVRRKGKAVFEDMRWGWRPGWSTGLQTLAKGETVDSKRTFRPAFMGGQRCLIPADGFYEWRKEPDGTKQPMLFSFGAEAPLFYLAGLYDTFAGLKDAEEGASEDCFLIITTEANAEVMPVAHRMPVILRTPESWHAWLAPEVPPALSWCHHQAAGLTSYPVSKAVNNVRYDGPECIERAEPPQQLLL